MSEIKILLVDDDEISLKVMGSILKKNNYDVESCTSSTVAWEIFRQKKFHIAILDIMMPDIDGIELLRLMKNYDALSQIFLVTGAISISKAVRALEHGATDCLLKPIESENFIKVVKECETKLERWRYLIQMMAQRSKEQEKAIH